MIKSLELKEGLEGTDLLTSTVLAVNMLIEEHNILVSALKHPSVTDMHQESDLERRTREVAYNWKDPNV